MMTHKLAKFRFVAIRLYLVALGVTWLDLQAQPVLSPKHKEVVDSLGKPMFKLSDLIPKEIAVIVLPPALTNIVQPLECDPTLRAEGYIWSAGTNQGPPYRWQTNTTNPQAVMRFTTRDDYQYLHYVVQATNYAGTSDYSNEVRNPDWLFNFSRVGWTPAIRALLCTSPDRRFWACYYVTPPVTNAIILTENQFFMCQTPGPNGVLMNITLLREWNDKVYPPRFGQ